MKNLALIPARGGSKRIPKKNIRLFNGKPIIAYSIECAINSGLFDEVMVSTDSEEIADIAKQYGAKIPFFRTEVNASDFATTYDVIQEVSDCYTQKGIDFDHLCCIYATSPLVQEKDLKEGLEKLIKESFDTVFSAVAFSYPVWRGFEMLENYKTQMVWPEFESTRSQDLKKVYHDAGQWYWLNMKKKPNRIFTDNSGSIILDEMNVQDIDTITDWKLAELKYQLIHSKKI